MNKDYKISDEADQITRLPSCQYRLHSNMCSAERLFDAGAANVEVRDYQPCRRPDVFQLSQFRVRPSRKKRWVARIKQEAEAKTS